MKTLQFDEGFTEVPVEVLRRTIKLEGAMGGLPKSRPIEHFELLDRLTDMVSDKLSLTPVYEPILVDGKKCRRVMWDGKDDACPVENYVVNNLTTRINIKRKGDKKHHPAIAVTYTDRGIQVGFGVNVSVCTNLCIFGGTVVSTYQVKGHDKTPFEESLRVISDWLNDFDVLTEQNVKTIEKLEKVSFEDRQVDELIGRLFTKAVNANYGDKSFSPLSQNQITKLATDRLDFIKNNDSHTAWDFLMWGTELFKGRTNDLTTLILNDSAFCDEVVEYAQIVE